MASIFLSYAREDVSKAERVAQALGSAGHKVWWDRQIHAGSRFSKEIDAALRSADLVMVLWSKSSVDSAWVHDEATAGRDTGRLIPVRLDNIEPPLGFRQYQAIDLIGRRGQTDAAIRRLLARISERLGAEVIPHDLPSPTFRRRGRQAFALIGAAAIAMIALGMWFLNPWSQAHPNSVVVAAARDASGPASGAMARSIAVDLSQYKAGPLASANIQGDDGSRYTPTLRAEVNLSRTGNEAQLDLSLRSARSMVLWTASLKGNATGATDLRQRAAAELGGVLSCAFDPLVVESHLDPELLGLYLDGCARMADINEGVDEATIDSFRQITIKAPSFAPAWANLALLEYKALTTAPEPEQHDLAMRAGEHMTRAKALDATLPQNFVVEAFVAPWGPTYLARALPIIDAGLRLNPNSALLHNYRAGILTSTGRINEAVRSARRAVELDPLSPNLLDSYVFALVYSGRVDAAKQQLAAAEARWPGSSSLEDLRYKFDLRYGDPANALRLLERRQGASNQFVSASDRSWQLYLKARANPTAANVQAALDAFRARYQKNSNDVLAYVQTLGTFDRVNGVYQALSGADAINNMTGNSDILFRPFMRSTRADPRFMKLASQLGLLSFWRKTGVWPDFCRDPQVGYDCRKEGNKYRG